MITLKFIISFSEVNGIDKLAAKPAQLGQLVQLAKFWAGQHGITISPREVNADRTTETVTFLIPDQATWDAVNVHASDNGIDLLDLSTQFREFVEAEGGTYEKVVEGA